MRVCSAILRVYSAIVLSDLPPVAQLVHALRK